MHEHSWYFTLAPARWSASCACGVAVNVDIPVPGRSLWRWTLHGHVAPVKRMLDGIGSVQQARRQLLAGMAAGRN